MIEGTHAGRPDSHLRHHQHDRRRGRAVSDRATARSPTGRRAARAPGPRGQASDAAARSAGQARRPRTRASSPCTIDGKEVVVKPGDQHDRGGQGRSASDIPYYCYHPRLSHRGQLPHVPGRGVATRRKLVPGLPDAARRGHGRSRPTTPKVKEQQRAVMEFLLLNHPVDCAICDQAGECKLQDYYMRYDHQPSRLDGPKVHEGQAQGARARWWSSTRSAASSAPAACASCARWPRSRSSASSAAAATSVIDTFPGKPLDDQLLGQHRRHLPGGRAAQPRLPLPRRGSGSSPRRPVVCTGCSRGCNTFARLHGRRTPTATARARTRPINKSWMCDQGRLSYKSLNQHRVLRGRCSAAARTAREAAARRGAEVARRAAQAAGRDRGRWRCSPRRWPRNEDLLAGLAVRPRRAGRHARSTWAAGPRARRDDFLMTRGQEPQPARGWSGLPGRSGSR